MVESISFSQVFNNSQRNSLRGVVTGSLCPPPLLGAPNVYKSRIIIRYRSPLSFDLVCRNGETRKRRLIRALCPRHATHPVPCSSSSAHKRIPIPALFPQRASAYQFLSFVLGAAQAHTDPISFVLGAVQVHADLMSFALGAVQAYANAVLLCPQESTHVCTSQSRGERGPRPRAYSSWPVPTARYGAAVNLIVPIASMGHMGSALLPRSSPRQTTLAAEILLPLLPPV